MLPLLGLKIITFKEIGLPLRDLGIQEPNSYSEFKQQKKSNKNTKQKWFYSTFFHSPGNSKSLSKFPL